MAVQTLTTWQDDMETASPPIFGDKNFLPPYRSFRWYNRGHKNEAGFFYHKRTDEMILSKPWQATEVFKNEPGWRAEGVSIAPVCYRSRPFVWVKAQPYDRRRYLPEWDGESQFFTEIVRFVRGSTDIWIMAGDGLTGKAYIGMLNDYRLGLLTYARSVGGLNVPPWAFWLPMTGRKEADGSTRFDPASGADDDKGGVVTLPDLIYPDKPVEALAETYKVGPYILSYGVDVRQMFADWLRE